MNDTDASMRIAWANDDQLEDNNDEYKVRISLGTSSLLERQDLYYSTTATWSDYTPYTDFMIFNALRDDFPAA